jgi:hypothetical protein
MKNIHKGSAGTRIALLAIFLILLCQEAISQPGYRPRLRLSPYQSGDGPYSRNQSRQGYDKRFQMGGDQPFISMGIHIDPLISWFTTDNYDTRNDGAIPGFNFGVSYNKYFGPNYSFSSGVNIIHAGGRLISRRATSFRMKNYSNEILIVEPGKAITYRISYLSIPLGIKLQTSKTSYGIFFADLGFDPKIVIGGRADIPSINIMGGNALAELKSFNLSYHIMAGLEYPLGGNNNIVAGIGFDNNILDITSDKGDQLWDMVSHKLLSFRIGITF